MKHHYFGDINGYLKYGLLRGRTASTRLSLAVWFAAARRSADLWAMVHEMLVCTGAPEAFAFRTSHVASFLLAQERHRAIVGGAAEAVARTWAPHIALAHRCVWAAEDRAAPRPTVSSGAQ